jgi:hypothetical protein
MPAEQNAIKIAHIAIAREPDAEAERRRRNAPPPPHASQIDRYTVRNLLKVYSQQKAGQ